MFFFSVWKKKKRKNKGRGVWSATQDHCQNSGNSMCVCLEISLFLKKYFMFLLYFIYFTRFSLSAQNSIFFLAILDLLKKYNSCGTHVQLLLGYTLRPSRVQATPCVPAMSNTVWLPFSCTRAFWSRINWKLRMPWYSMCHQKFVF